MSPNDQAQLLARFDKLDAALAGLSARLANVEAGLSARLANVEAAVSAPEPAEPIGFATAAALEEVRKLASDTQLIAMRVLNGEHA